MPDKIGHFRLSRHAEWEMSRRNIPLEMVQAVVTAPEQRVSDESSAGRSVYQSRIRFADGTMYLLRVIVAEEHDPPVIVTVYRTSKIQKYWSAE